jgi:hypothetical protein
MVKHRCVCCGESFRPCPQTPNQRYCSKRACQQARKRDWQNRKRREDPDYRDNQREAQRRWAGAHGGYWRTWREAHPAYVERNRLLQRKRNARRRRGRSVGGCGASRGIAKMDAWRPESGFPPGTYRVVPWSGGDCKDGRVNPNNLFLISPIDIRPGGLQRDDLMVTGAGPA